KKKTQNRRVKQKNKTHARLTLLLTNRLATSLHSLALSPLVTHSPARCDSGGSAEHEREQTSCLFFVLRCDDSAAASATRVRCNMTRYCLRVQRSAGTGAMRLLSLREQDDSVVECMAIFKVSEFDALSGYGEDIYWCDKSLNCTVTAIRWMIAALSECRIT